jgi:hypothetical protein
VPHRPAVDVAFSVARWVAKGGTYMNYYMAYGGTTFGRKTGGPLLVTSYDYDVQISEFGLQAEPKYSLTQKLHSVLFSAADVLLGEDAVPPTVTTSSTCESHTYGANIPDATCVTFLSNIGEKEACVFDVSGGGRTLSVEVPAWSVSIVSGSCKERPATPTLLINTKTDAVAPNKITTKAVTGPFALDDFETYQESVPPSGGTPIVDAHVVDQLGLTRDETDYMWISTNITGRETAGVVELSFSMGEAGGPVMYAFVNGQLSSSTIRASVEASSSEVDNLILAAGRAASSRATAPLSKGVPVKVEVDLPAGDSQLDLLVASTGIKNYGPHLELIQVGIVSDILLDETPLVGYSQMAGMDGERMEIYAGAKRAAMSPAVTSGAKPLTWYRSSFPTPQASLYGETRPIALDISQTSLTKGALWVNGVMLGRYWGILAVGSCNDDCSSASYVGAYNANRCRTGCGEMSQSLYKIPFGLLHSVDSGELNTVTFFEEGRGTPAGVGLVSVSMESSE